MTRAKDISKILTDANISGTLDVAGDFTVVGSSTFDDIKLTTVALPAAGNPSIALRDTNNIVYHQSGSGNSIVLLDSSQNTMYNVSSSSHIFNTGNSERMRIDSSGNVGINESNPSSSLHIYGSSPKITLEHSNENGTAQIYTTAQSAIVLDADPDNTDNGTPILFNIDGTERMRIDDAGNVGIGTSSPSNLLSIDASGTVTTRYTSTGSAFSLLQVDNTGGMTFSADHGNNASGSFLSFQTDGGSERMKINSTGNVIVHSDLCVGTSTADGKITVSGNSNPLVRFTHTQNANEKLLILTHTYASGSQEATMIEFRDAGQTIRGSIKTSSFGTSYATSSDYRLKESITYDFDATTRLKQLKPCRFNFIGVADNTVDGFLAHEVSSIVPEAIIGDKDAMTEEVLYVDGDEIPDGKKIGDVKEASVIDPQGIDQSKLVPLLVKTIQELEARITALEGA